MVIVREFTEQDRERLFDMIQEIKEYDADFEGMDDIGRIEDYDAFLMKLEKWKHQERIGPNYSPQTTFGVFDNERLIGGFVLRHKLKGMLIDHGGNIGYLIRPGERKKGFGKMLQKRALEKAREIGLEKVLVTCREDNIGSIKIIESNSGKYENSYYDESLRKAYRRYWIQCG